MRAAVLLIVGLCEPVHGLHIKITLKCKKNYGYKSSLVNNKGTSDSQLALTALLKEVGGGGRVGVQL